MEELLVNSISKAKYDIYVDGVLTDATGSVTLTVYKDDVTLLSDVVATRDGEGKYSYILPVNQTVGSDVYAVTSTEGKLKLEWNFTLNSNAMSVIDYYEVVTPYAPWSYFSTTMTYADYIECERIARFLINSYCGQEFGSIYATYAVEGYSTDSLILPRRLYKYESINWLDNVWSSNYGVIIGTNGYPQWYVAGEGWVLRCVPQNNYIDPLKTEKDKFKRNTTHNVTGWWGYEFVPSRVVEAAKILIADLLCSDRKYRDKYLESIKISDWRLQYKDEAFDGTGNATADELLAEYVITPNVGFI